MRRPAIAAAFVLLLIGLPVGAQADAPVRSALLPNVGPGPTAEPATEGPLAAEPVASTPWQTAWGLLGLRAVPTGLRVAPNGGEYHPNFTIDLNLNAWLWRSAGLYLFVDGRLWGERSEYGVTNGRDGWLGTSKREFDLAGGAAWNYAGAWELRAFGYTNNNLNRGNDLVQPSGFTDGFGLENRYYLSPEYARLGQTGYDVTRATFLSFGYFPSKDMIGNDGQTFRPGLLLRAYLTYPLWNWPCYVYGDFQYIGERSCQPRLLLFDIGLAVRPFQRCPQWELRLGSENTADVQVRDVFSLAYVSFRYIY